MKCAMRILAGLALWPGLRYDTNEVRATFEMAASGLSDEDELHESIEALVPGAIHLRKDGANVFQECPIVRYARFLLCAAMVQLGMLAQAHAGLFTFTGSVQEYTVPTTGVYFISATGAEGGLGQGGVAGLGAYLSGDYMLTVGTRLQIVVGGQGGSNQEGGGGGGSFVYVTGAAQPILVAGGGGGGGVYASYFGGVSGGQITTDGAAGLGPGGGAGGTGGNGGSGGTLWEGQNGGGGAGWLSSGTAGASSPPYYYSSGDGGQGAPTFTGGAGGTIISGAGGFGGGGGAGGSSGGGGGGYSGGGGCSGYGVGGGGGGSYLDPSFTNTTMLADVNYGNGEVGINSLASPVPEPSTLVLLGTSLIVLSGRRRLIPRAK